VKDSIFQNTSKNLFHESDIAEEISGGDEEELKKQKQILKYR
jgi:hypothetical protein